MAWMKMAYKRELEIDVSVKEREMKNSDSLIGSIGLANQNLPLK